MTCISIDTMWCRIIGRRQRSSSPMTASLLIIRLSYTGITRIRHIKLHIHFFLSLIIKLFILKLNLLSTNLTGNYTEKMCSKRRESDETIMVEWMHQRLSMLLDPDDGVEGADGADDTADEAATSRSELRRALSISSSFSKC